VVTENEYLSHLIYNATGNHNTSLSLVVELIEYRVNATGANGVGVGLSCHTSWSSLSTASTPQLPTGSALDCLVALLGVRDQTGDAWVWV
jgi:hypothetical protein